MFESGGMNMKQLLIYHLKVEAAPGRGAGARAARGGGGAAARSGGVKGGERAFCAPRAAPSN